MCEGVVLVGSILLAFGIYSSRWVGRWRCCRRILLGSSTITSRVDVTLVSLLSPTFFFLAMMRLLRTGVLYYLVVMISTPTSSETH